MDDDVRAEIVDLDTMDQVTKATEAATNQILGEGLLGALGVIFLIALALFFRWVLRKLDEKDKLIFEQQKIHDQQLATLYTTHKQEIADMNAAFIEKLEGIQEKNATVINNNSAAMHEVKTTLASSLANLGQRVENLEGSVEDMHRKIRDISVTANNQR